jgi:hypothetical protein
MKLYEYVLSVKDQFSDKFRALQAAAGQSNSKVDDLNKKMNQTSSIASGLGRALAGAFAVGSVIALGKDIIETTAKFQKYDAVLTNTLGSADKARQAQQMITDFAAKTPFQVDELIGSYVKLANQGFTPTQKELTKLGDLASSQGKSFNQLTEAVLDATTFQFERLKEFGIKASQHGDKIKFTFKGVTTEIGKNSDEVRKYLLSLGDMKGVAGGMEAISKTIGGQISNLADSFDALKVKIGGMFSDGISSGIGFLSNILGGVNKFLDFISTKGSELSNVFAPLASYFRPILDAFDGISQKINAIFSGGNMLESVFNKIGNVLLFFKPLLTSFGNLIDTLINTIFDVGSAVFNLFSKLGESSLFKGFLKSFVDTFSLIAQAAKNVLGGIGDLVTGILTGNFDKIKSGFKSIGTGLLDAAYTPGAAYNGFQKGYNDKSKSVDFFAKNTKVDGLAKVAGLDSYGATDTTSSANAKSKQGTDSISAGGSKSVSIIIQKVQFAETNTQVFENGNKEMAVDAEDKMKEFLSRVINGGLYTANQ